MSYQAGKSTRGFYDIPYTVRIWVDAEEGCQTHIYIQRSDDKPQHYFHWDHMLLWHDTDIIHARSVTVRG